MGVPTFASQLLGVRQGDLLVTEGFVRTYRPFVIDEARRVLQANPLQRVCDPSDIGQSVITRLVTGLREGEFILEGDLQLRHLLRTMAWNKVTSIARRERARGGASLESPLRAQDSDLLERLAVAGDRSPSQLAATNDFLQVVRARLPSDLAGVLDRWLEGYLWDEIGAELGQQGHTIRVRFRRALKRVLESLGGATPPAPAPDLSSPPALEDD